MKGLVRWPGGKGNHVGWLSKLVPQHDVYVEPFGGGASLLFAMQPDRNRLEVYNDVHKALVTLFRVVRDSELFPIFVRKVYTTPYSREEFRYCRDTWFECEGLELAYRYYITCRQAFGGSDSGTGWAYDKTALNKCVGRWMYSIAQLPAIHERLMNVQVDCLDYKAIFAKYDSPSTFFYCDPPYMDLDLYQHKFTYDNHCELLRCITALQGKVLLSGYRNDLYSILDELGWISKDYDVHTHTLQHKRDGTSARVETIWMNYSL